MTGGAEQRRELQAAHQQRAFAAAERVKRGHLDAAEREALAAMLTAWGTVPVHAVIHGPLLVTYEAAVIKLTEPRAERPAVETAVASDAAVARDGVE